MNDILAIFDQMLRRAGDEGITVQQIADHCQCSKSTVNKHLKKKISAKEAEHIGFRLVPDATGRPQSTPVYAVTKQFLASLGRKKSAR